MDVGVFVTVLAAVALAMGVTVLGVTASALTTQPTALQTAAPVPLLPGATPAVRVLLSKHVFVAALATTSATTTMPSYAASNSGGYTDLGVTEEVTYASGVTGVGSYVTDTLVMQAVPPAPPVIIPDYQLVTGDGLPAVLGLAPAPTATSSAAATQTLRRALPDRTYVSSVLESMRAAPAWAMYWSSLMPLLYLGSDATASLARGPGAVVVPLDVHGSLQAASTPALRDPGRLYLLPLQNGSYAVLAVGQTQSSSPTGSNAVTFATGATVSFPGPFVPTPATSPFGAATTVLGAPALLNRVTVFDIKNAHIRFGPPS